MSALPPIGAGAVVPPRGGRFTTGNWYQLQDRVAIARGGLHQEGGAWKYFVRVWDSSGKLVTEYRQHRWTPTVVTVSRDGRFAASADKFGDITAWSDGMGEAVINVGSLWKRRYIDSAGAGRACIRFPST